MSAQTPSTPDEEEFQQRRAVPSGNSGEGAASALATLKSQDERRKAARLDPTPSPGPGTASA